MNRRCFLDEKAAAVQAKQRRLIVISGDDAWIDEALALAIDAIDEPWCLVSATVHQHLPTISSKKAKNTLGGEHANLIFDARQGFDVDAFGILSGTVQAGGLCLLLTPPVEMWATHPDNTYPRYQAYSEEPAAQRSVYLQRLARVITQFSARLWLTPHFIQSSIVVTETHTPTEAVEPPYKSVDQARAVAATHKVVRGHRRRPLVLRADRGRGKSAALGIAIGQLLNEGVENIVLCAPSKQSATVVFKHIEQTVDAPARLQQLHFFSPDELLRSTPIASLVVVDEAAAIPTFILERLLNHYSRMVFASTVHGYEGTGRGFAVRFMKTLASKAPQFRQLTLEQPVRWQAGDALEAFTAEALLLNAQPVEQLSGVEPVRIEPFTAEQLLADESMLQQVFGLLVLAHYQTKPSDLRQLLDGHNVRLFVALNDLNQVIGVLVGVVEGGLPQALHQPIAYGQRRVQGHLLPQSISFQLGVQEAAGMIGLRVMRIAVHPEHHRQGIGLRMLAWLKSHANHEWDYLGTVFGATVELHNFWHRAGFAAVRVGINKDAASGTHSVMMLQPLTSDGEVLSANLTSRFLDQFLLQLMNGLQDLDSLLVADMIRVTTNPLPLTNVQQSALEAFFYGNRALEEDLVLMRSAALLLLRNDSLVDDYRAQIVEVILKRRAVSHNHKVNLHHWLRPYLRSL